jgi:hypothetical protein
VATFQDLQSGGIRGLLPPNDPAADKANKILAVACGPAQIALDMYLGTPADIQAETLATLESWQAALALAEAAMAEAYSLVASNPGTVEVSVDALTVTHRKRVFPETPEVPHAR